VRYDGPVLAEGSWLHERSTSLQRNSPTVRDGLVLDSERETWTSWDGEVYLVERRPSAGWTSYDVLDERFAPSIGNPTPAFSANLPDEAGALRAYLDQRVFGSSSHEEAVFEALIHLATSHTLPPRTLAAALEALAEVDGVQTTDERVEGRPAVEVSFEDDVTSSAETMVVDRSTGQVLAMRQHSRASDYTSTTTLSEVVTAIPADVLATFTTYGDGGITCDADRPDCSLPH